MTSEPYERPIKLPDLPRATVPAQRQGAPTWAIVVSTVSVFLALVLSLILQRWLTSIAWLAAFAMSLGWLTERGSNERS